MWNTLRDQFTPIGKLIFDYSLLLAAFITAFFVIKNGIVKLKKPIVWLRTKTLDPLLGTSEIKENTIRQAAAINQRLDGFGEVLNKILDNQSITQKQLAISMASHTTLLNVIGTNTFKTDEEGSWTFVNDNLLRLTGMQYDDMLGNGYINMIAPSDRSRVINEIRNATKDKRTVEIDFSIINRDRKLLHAVLRTEKIQCAKEIHFGFLGTIMILEENVKN